MNKGAHTLSCTHVLFHRMAALCWPTIPSSVFRAALLRTSASERVCNSFDACACVSKSKILSLFTHVHAHTHTHTHTRTHTHTHTGADVVLGFVERADSDGSEDTSPEQRFQRLKHSPGSGVLSVSVVSDGPTRILRITDENKKVSHPPSFPLSLPAK